MSIELRYGQVVVQECNYGNPLSRLVMREEQSRATHCFLVLDSEHAIEATFPRVRVFKWRERLAALAKADRAVVALDLPALRLGQRYNVVTHAATYEGRWYDVGQLLLFAMTGAFWHDGSGTLICSRLVTASYREGAGVSLFDPDRIAALYPPCSTKSKNLTAGYATPADLLATSRLEVVQFRPSSKVPLPSAFAGD